MAIKVTREDFEMLVVPDKDPDTSFLEQEGFEDRLADYRAGNHSYVGIQASVTIKVPCGKDSHVEHVVTTPGVWGVESDADSEYHKEVFSQECDVLEDMLREMGVLPKEGEAPSPADPEDRDTTLALARSLIRDLAHGWPVKELACPPEEVVARLTSLLGDRYDFETGEQS